MLADPERHRQNKGGSVTQPLDIRNGLRKRPTCATPFSWVRGRKSAGDDPATWRDRDDEDCSRGLLCNVSWLGWRVRPPALSNIRCIQLQLPSPSGTPHSSFYTMARDPFCSWRMRNLKPRWTYAWWAITLMHRYSNFRPGSRRTAHGVGGVAVGTVQGSADRSWGRRSHHKIGKPKGSEHWSRRWNRPKVSGSFMRSAEPPSRRSPAWRRRSRPWNLRSAHCR